MRQEYHQNLRTKEKQIFGARKENKRIPIRQYRETRQCYSRHSNDARHIEQYHTHHCTHPECAHLDEYERHGKWNEKTKQKESGRRKGRKERMEREKERPPQRPFGTETSECPM